MTKPIVIAASMNNSRERWEARSNGFPVPPRTGRKPQLSEEQKEELFTGFAKIMADLYRQEKEAGII